MTMLDTPGVLTLARTQNFASQAPKHSCMQVLGQKQSKLSHVPGFCALKDTFLFLELLLLSVS